MTTPTPSPVDRGTLLDSRPSEGLGFQSNDSLKWSLVPPFESMVVFGPSTVVILFTTYRLYTGVLDPCSPDLP